MEEDGCENFVRICVPTEIQWKQKTEVLIRVGSPWGNQSAASKQCKQYNNSEKSKEKPQLSQTVTKEDSIYT